MNFLFDLADGVWRIIRGALRPFWRITRSVVRTLLPGQPRIVHTVVTAALIVAEVAGIWYVIRTNVYGT